MAEINLPDLSLLWASAGDILQPSDSKIQQGWQAEIPPRQWFNWLDNRQDEAITHIVQKGISVWNDKITYYSNTSGTRAYVQGSDGEIYKGVTTSLNQDPVLDTTGTYWISALSTGHGQCRFDYVSPTQCKLTPFGGVSINVAGQVRKIPSSGITISNSGLSATTLYYCYVYVSAGVLTLEFSSTGHTQHTNGVEIKSGDPTRTLVGMVYTGAGSPGVFVNNQNAKCVLSYFNRRSVTSSYYSTAASAAFSNTTRAIVWPESTISFITWADESCVALASADAGRVTGAGGMSGALHTDSVANGNVSAWSAFDINGVGSITSVMFGQNLSEGFHTNALYCGVSSGSGRLVTITNNCTVRG